MKHETSQEFYDQFLNFVKRRVRSLEDAEDITQMVFTKLAAAVLRDEEKVSSWLYAVTRNAITDYYRKVHRAEEIKTFEEDDHFKEDVVAEDISSCLQPLLLLLGEEERTLLQKVDMEGKSQKTLAKEQGVSYPTVKSKVQRARKKLKGLLLACCKERIGEFKGSDGCC